MVGQFETIVTPPCTEVTGVQVIDTFEEVEVLVIVVETLVALGWGLAKVDPRASPIANM